MRYCIGCVQFNIEPGEGYSMGSTMTGAYGTDAAGVFCVKGHWFEEMGTSADLETFRKCMEKAETCPDFVEREV